MDGTTNLSYVSTGTGSRDDGLNTLRMDDLHLNNNNNTNYGNGNGSSSRPSNGSTSVDLSTPTTSGKKTSDEGAASDPSADVPTASDDEPKRDSWGNDLEFLMSCIALSVGLGNVWRFPFAALENGGGAFLIPYLVVLLLVGKPIYYLEMLMGQFSGRGSYNVYDVVPFMRGIGYGQLFAVAALLSYYASLLALTVRYFLASFKSVLPWSECQPEWGETCIDSTRKMSDAERANGTSLRPSAEFYF